MAHTRLKTTKDGKKRFYEICVHLSAGSPQYTKRWYVPDGWSQRAIDRELSKVANAFEEDCKAGKILTKAQQKEKAAAEAAEAAKVQTLKQYGEKVFMPAKSIRMAENSRSSYQTNLNKHIYPTLGDMKLPEITAPQITALLLEKQRSGLSHASAVKIYVVLCGLFKMARHDNVIQTNPMLDVERPEPRKDERQKTAVQQAYTAEESAKILAALKDEPLKWQCLVMLLATTGMRRGECCGLRWSAINFKDKSVTIKENLCYTADAGVYSDTAKNRHDRVVGISDYMVSLLKQWKAIQSNDCISPYVFNQKGKSSPMHPQSPTRYLKKLGEKLGFSDLHPHALRHTFASLTITNGADIVSVAEVLGHSDTSVTLRTYAHASQESKRRTTDLFTSIIQTAAQEKTPIDKEKAGQG